MTFKSWLLPIGIGVLVLAAGLAIGWAGQCPCDRLPGLTVHGEVQDIPVQDWSFANEVPLCSVQVQTWRPHAIVLNCMASEGELFVSCSRCEGKYWSSAALADPEGFIQVGPDVFPVRITRVTEGETLDRAWRARANKLGRDAGDRPDHWWSFNLTSR